MADELASHVNQNAGLTGMRLYSPGLLAAYTILINVPLGLFLYGLNVRARGRIIYSWIVFGWSVLTGIWLLFLVLNPYPPPQQSNMLLLIGLLCGMNMYKLESSIYKRARAAGATRAKWWPPFLVALGITGAAYLYDAFWR